MSFISVFALVPICALLLPATVGVGIFVISVLTQYLANWAQKFVVDGSRSKLVNVLLGVPQGSVSDPQLFLLYTVELSSMLDNKLYGYVDDFTLV